MKITIKTGLTAIALLICVNLSAQEKPVTFGVKGGLNLSNMTQDLKGDAKVGFNLGVTMDYALQNNFYLLTGLSYSLEGTKEDDVKLNLSYLK
ncbi:MAG: outer membrane beta-barrel protein, partial [Bacteroides graminisolvens]|uniref:outer membrane beta-barrel protein n=1 Tax=Bacteroides graminisolvens TaxID=477666 RepID=UPI003A8ADA27